MSGRRAARSHNSSAAAVSSRRSTSADSANGGDLSDYAADRTALTAQSSTSISTPQSASGAAAAASSAAGLNSAASGGSGAAPTAVVSSGSRSSGSSVFADAEGPTVGGPGFGLWRAIASELGKLQDVQRGRESLMKNEIEENRLSGVLAVFEVDGVRVVEDYFLQAEQDRKNSLARNKKQQGAAAASGPGAIVKRLNKKRGQNVVPDDEYPSTSPDSEEDIGKLAQSDAESLTRAYKDAKTQLSQEKKTLEELLESLKRLVPDSVVAVALSAARAAARRSSSSASSNIDRSSIFGGNISAAGAAASAINSGDDDDGYANVPAVSSTRKRRLESDEGKPFTLKRSRASMSSASISGLAAGGALGSSPSASANAASGSFSAPSSSAAAAAASSIGPGFDRAGSSSSTAAAHAAAPGTAAASVGASSRISPTPTSSTAAYSIDHYLKALFNGFPEKPLSIGSQVALRLRKSRAAEEEWIQCEVTKIYNDGVKYEVRDPEPDENGNPGQSYKVNPRDLLPIPDSQSQILQLPLYPARTQVLARYPETTTFYRAEVVGTTKRDGKYRLKFEGEEEENKEQEVERRLVLPIRK